MIAAVTLPWTAFFRAIVAFAARCPACGSDSVRPSRASYEGPLAPLFRLQPWRCRSCLKHFALPARIRVAAGADSPERGATISESSPPASSAASAVGRRKHLCPNCGRRAARRADRQPAHFWARVLRRTSYHCDGCDFRFEMTHVGRLVADVLVIVAVASMLLGGIAAFMASRGAGPGADKGKVQHRR
jgi:hypothetical protein